MIGRIIADTWLEGLMIDVSELSCGHEWINTPLETISSNLVLGTLLNPFKSLMNCCRDRDKYHRQVFQVGQLTASKRGTVDSAWACKVVRTPCRFPKAVPSALDTLSLSAVTPSASSIFLLTSLTRPLKGVLSIMNWTIGATVLLTSQSTLPYSFQLLQ